MRQAQQNRRGRGRNNNNNSNGNSNRKGQNPLTRSFESNGPDVKIRGTPSHIAEKYVAMARDALSSGDPVLAENYLQHAEHYNRIIMTFRESQGSQHGDHGQPQHNTIGRHRNPGDPIDDDAFGDDDDGMDLPVPRGSEPQPNMRGNDRDERRRGQQRRERGPDRPQERAADRAPDRALDRDRPERDRPERDRPDRDRPERERPSERDRGERHLERAQERVPERAVDRDRGVDRERAPDRDRGVDRERAPERERIADSEQPGAGRASGRGGRRERYAQSDDQPAFLKRPVRRPRSVEADDDAVVAAPARAEKSDEAAE